MMRAKIALALALVIALMSPASGFAVGESDAQAGPDIGIGELSDRYESLNELGNSLTDEESVVIATRVGVLVSANRALNNSEVSFTGQVVNGIVRAGDGYKWANLMGTSNSVISLFLTDDQADLVRYVGDYQTTGTTLKVTGTYHIACPEHEGELDVHASNVEVVDAGGPVIHLVAPGRLELAFALCALAAILLAAFIVARVLDERKARQ